MKILQQFNRTFCFVRGLVKTMSEALFDIFSNYEAGHSSCPRMTVCFVFKRSKFYHKYYDIALLLRNKSARGKF